MLKIQKDIWEFDNLIEPYLSDYLEKLCVFDARFKMGNNFLGTSGAPNKFFEKVGLNDTISEYLQLSDLFIDYRSNEHNDRLNTHTPFLLPLFLLMAKMDLKTSLSDILRAKINVQPKVTKENKGKYNFPHIDYNNQDAQNILSIIYYLNDSDGDTFFFNEDIGDENHFEKLKKITINKRISPSKGKIVAFRGDILHAGSHPIDSDFRAVINYNVKISNAPPSLKKLEEDIYSKHKLKS